MTTFDDSESTFTATVVHSGPRCFNFDNLRLDELAHEVIVDGRTVDLTLREFELLVYFCERRGQALARQLLCSGAWGNSFAGGLRTVDIYVSRLRAKLGASVRLETLRGVGYRLSAQAGESALPSATPAVS